MTRLLCTLVLVAVFGLAADSTQAGNWNNKPTHAGYQPYQNRVAYPVGGWNAQNFRAAYGNTYGANYRAYHGSMNSGYGNAPTFSYGGYPATGFQTIPLNGGTFNIPGGGTVSGFTNIIVLPPGATVQTLHPYCD